jgi:hypothetical protein
MTHPNLPGLRRAAEIAAGHKERLEREGMTHPYFISGVDAMASVLRREAESLEQSPVSDDGWRAIESAPKDGSYILVAGLKFEDQTYMEVTSFYMGRWQVAWMDGYAEPTHWRPLPPPPAKEGQ